MKSKTLLLTMILSSCFVNAQFSGSLQSSYQLGNMPYINQGDRSNLYNQINLHYNQQNLSIGLKMENFQVNEGEDYSQLSQLFLEYQKENLTITVGNFYEILGRGVLLRGYEIPGAIYEDERGFRQRYGFYKDIEGLSIVYSNDFTQTKVLYGKVLDNFSPPAMDEINKNIRRPFLIQGGELNFISLSEFQPGIIYLRNDYDNQINYYSGLNFQGFMENGLQYYAEYTQSFNKEYRSLQYDKNGPYGLYGSVSYSHNFFSSTFEIKDYNNYSLFFNDPPPLVKEHSFSLLNRSTHSIIPEGEKGYQFETIFNVGGLNTATVNHARAYINFGGETKTFYEYYADLNYFLDSDWLTKIFIDFAKDETERETNRITFGLSSENNLFNSWSYGAELQYQQFEKTFVTNVPNEKVTDILFIGTINHSPDFSTSFTLEEINNEIRTSGYYGIDISYIYYQTNTLALFYGKRPGGNACSGGVCYNIQPFKGFELRLTSNF